MISHTFTAQEHQTDDRDGAFKAFLPVSSQKWLSTLNLQVDLPVTRLAVFADLGATDEQFQLAGRTSTQRVFYDAGLVVPVIPDIFQLYVPVVGSQFRNGLPDSRKDFTDRIRFVLHLEQLNPFRQINQLLAQ